MMASSLEFLENENSPDFITLKEIVAANIKTPHSWRELRAKLLNILKTVQFG